MNFSVLVAFSVSSGAGVGNGKYQAVGVWSVLPVVADFLHSPAGQTCLSLLAFKMMLCSVSVRSAGSHVWEGKFSHSSFVASPSMLAPVVSFTGITCPMQWAHPSAEGIAKPVTLSSHTV